MSSNLQLLKLKTPKAWDIRKVKLLLCIKLWDHNFHIFDPRITEHPQNPLNVDPAFPSGSQIPFNLHLYVFVTVSYLLQSF